MVSLDHFQMNVGKPESRSSGHHYQIDVLIAFAHIKHPTPKKHVALVEASILNRSAVAPRVRRAGLLPGVSVGGPCFSHSLHEDAQFLQAHVGPGPHADDADA